MTRWRFAISTSLFLSWEAAVGMPKKFQGENSKAATAKARKAEAKAVADARKKQQEEDALWQETDKHVLKKEQRKVRFLFSVSKYVSSLCFKELLLCLILSHLNCVYALLSLLYIELLTYLMTSNRNVNVSASSMYSVEFSCLQP